MPRCTARRTATSHCSKRNFKAFSSLFITLRNKEHSNGTRIRYNRHRRRPCGLRSRGCGRTPRVAHAAAHDGHGEIRVDVVQSGCRRRSKRTDSQRDRCTRRTNGTHRRPHDPPIPDAQPLERRRHVEPAGAMRQNPFFGGVAPHARKHAESLHLAGFGRGAAFRPARSLRCGRFRSGGQRHRMQDAGTAKRGFGGKFRTRPGAGSKLGRMRR